MLTRRRQRSSPSSRTVRTACNPLRRQASSPPRAHPRSALRLRRRTTSSAAAAMPRPGSPQAPASRTPSRASSRARRCSPSSTAWSTPTPSTKWASRASSWPASTAPTGCAASCASPGRRVKGFEISRRHRPPRPQRRSQLRPQAALVVGTTCGAKCGGRSRILNTRRPWTPGQPLRDLRPDHGRAPEATLTRFSTTFCPGVGVVQIDVATGANFERATLELRPARCACATTGPRSCLLPRPPRCPGSELSARGS